MDFEFLIKKKKHQNFISFSVFMFLFQKSSFLSKKSPVILLLEELYLKKYLAKAFFPFFFSF